MRNFTFLYCLLFTSILIGQPKPTDDSKIVEAYQIKNKLIENSRVKNVNFKNIGPTIMSGRVVALEVNPNDPDEFYVAYASGGVWHTINNGTSFNSISEDIFTFLSFANFNILFISSMAERLFNKD